MTIQQIYFGQQSSSVQLFGNQNGIAMFGGFSPTLPGPVNNVYNIINNTGVFAGRTSSPPSVLIRSQGWAVGYGGNLGVYVGGRKQPSPAAAPVQNTTVSNYVSSTGVIASDTPTPTWGFYTTNPNHGSVVFGYTSGWLQCLFLPGGPGPGFGLQNVNVIVSPVGVIGSQTPNANATNASTAGITYGNDKGIFAWGPSNNGAQTTPSVFQTLSNTGVLSTSTPLSNTGRARSYGLTYGNDKGMYNFGVLGSPSLVFVTSTAYVTNTGVIGADTPYTNATRQSSACGPYAGTKGWYYSGTFPSQPPTTLAIATQTLVSNTGVIAADTPSNGAQFEACGIGFG